MTHLKAARIDATAWAIVPLQDEYSKTTPPQFPCTRQTCKWPVLRLRTLLTLLACGADSHHRKGMRMC